MDHELCSSMWWFGRDADGADWQFRGVRLVTDSGAAMEQRPTGEPGDLHGFDGMCGSPSAGGPESGRFLNKTSTINRWATHQVTRRVSSGSFDSVHRPLHLRSQRHRPPTGTILLFRSDPVQIRRSPFHRNHMTRLDCPVTWPTHEF